MARYRFKYRLKWLAKRGDVIFDMGELAICSDRMAISMVDELTYERDNAKGLAILLKWDEDWQSWIKLDGEQLEEMRKERR